MDGTREMETQLPAGAVPTQAEELIATEGGSAEPIKRASKRDGVAQRIERKRGRYRLHISNGRRGKSLSP